MPGRPQGKMTEEKWTVRRETNCCCSNCVYPRYLHFAEPSANSDVTTAQTLHQAEQKFFTS